MIRQKRSLFYSSECGIFCICILFPTQSRFPGLPSHRQGAVSLLSTLDIQFLALLFLATHCQWRVTRFRN